MSCECLRPSLDFFHHLNCLSLSFSFCIFVFFFLSLYYCKLPHRWVGRVWDQAWLSEFLRSCSPACRNLKMQKNIQISFILFIVSFSVKKNLISNFISLQKTWWGDCSRGVGRRKASLREGWTQHLQQKSLNDSSQESLNNSSQAAICFEHHQDSTVIIT